MANRHHPGTSRRSRAFGTAALAVGGALLLSACGGVDDRGSGAPPASGDLEASSFETVAEGLEIPWGLAFVDDDTILVTERTGTVQVVTDGVVRAEPAGEVPALTEGEGGLLGIALHPDFPDERSVYLYFTGADDNRVSRFELDEDLRLGSEEVLLEGIPRAPTHDGGRIAFGPDGMLYVTTGDAADPLSAADPDALSGKILRIDADGGIPDDNPFDGSPVWTWGHRNPQGLAWDEAGNLYATEHGPSGEGGQCCNDEVNLIEPGSFYGWPYRAGLVAGFVEGEPPAPPVDPVATSGESATWAPAGVTVRTDGDGASLVVSTLGGSELLRFALDADDPAAVGEPTVVSDAFGRLRAATTGPDGCLYLTTSNTDGRGDPRDGDDRILRACPDAG